MKIGRRSTNLPNSWRTPSLLHVWNLARICEGACALAVVTIATRQTNFSKISCFHRCWSHYHSFHNTSQQDDSPKRITCQIWQPSTGQQEYRQENATGKTEIYVFMSDVVHEPVHNMHVVNQNPYTLAMISVQVLNYVWLNWNLIIQTQYISSKWDKI